MELLFNIWLIGLAITIILGTINGYDIEVNSFIDFLLLNLLWPIFIFCRIYVLIRKYIQKI